jgi:hypothetical protein
MFRYLILSSERCDLRVCTVLRGFVGLSLAAVASPIATTASDLPILDTYLYCARKIQLYPPYDRPPTNPDEFELRLSSCFQREGDSKRDARWRLRMIPQENRQTCINEGVAENSYRAICDCLDRFTGYLRG